MYAIYAARGYTEEIEGVSQELTTSRVAALEGESSSCEHAASSFRHEMLFYEDGDHGFLDGTLDLVESAIAAQAAVYVAVTPARAVALREALGDHAERVHFADMPRLGRNPARIIPMWQAFVSERASGNGRALGIGEAAWAGRSAAELAECERHEALLNVAFAGGPAWHMLCPYDLDALEDHVIVAAKHMHPLLSWDGESHDNEDYACAHEPPRPFAGTLPPPRGPLEELEFASADLAQVRHLVSDWARAQELPGDAVDELVLAVDELATNSIRYGGGAGTLRCWREADILQCEVQDAGWITTPLVGRTRPASDAHSGRGMWLANQLCDLVQIRSTPAGSVVRVHKLIAPQ